MYGKTLRGTRVYNTLCACDFGLLLLCVSSGDTVAHSSVGVGRGQPSQPTADTARRGGALPGPRTAMYFGADCKITASLKTDYLIPTIRPWPLTLFST